MEGFRRANRRLRIVSWVAALALIPSFASEGLAQTNGMLLQLPPLKPKLNFSTLQAPPPRLTLDIPLAQSFVVVGGRSYLGRDSLWDVKNLAWVPTGQFRHDTVWFRQGMLSLQTSIAELSQAEVCGGTLGPCDNSDTGFRSAFEVRLETGGMGLLKDTQLSLGWEQTTTKQRERKGPLWKFRGAF